MSLCDSLQLDRWQRWSEWWSVSWCNVWLTNHSLTYSLTHSLTALWVTSSSCWRGDTSWPKARVKTPPLPLPHSQVTTSIQWQLGRCPTSHTHSHSRTVGVETDPLLRKTLVEWLSATLTILRLTAPSITITLKTVRSPHTHTLTLLQHYQEW